MAKKKLPAAFRTNAKAMKKGDKLVTKGSKPNVTPKNIRARKGKK